MEGQFCLLDEEYISKAIKKSLNISDINIHPVWEGKSFKDYKVSIVDVIEDKCIKNWIDNMQIISSPDDLRKRLLEEKSQVSIRVRFKENGEVYEMMVHQVGLGSLCCMFYTHKEYWMELIKMIEKE